jgi:hypothetical protein
MAGAPFGEGAAFAGVECVDLQQLARFGVCQHQAAQCRQFHFKTVHHLDGDHVVPPVGLPQRRQRVRSQRRRQQIAPGPLPAGLLSKLQHDALAEGATLALIDRALAYQRLADITSAADRQQHRDPAVREETRRWSRNADDPARDGVPAVAFSAGTRREPGRLSQRDFDLGRSLGLLSTEGPPPAATAVLLTVGDRRADWLRAGQALQRVLAHAAAKWVFASLHTQPLENASIRALIRDRLSLPGAPQMVMQLGVSHSARSTARRAPEELIEN